MKKKKHGKRNVTLNWLFILCIIVISAYLIYTDRSKEKENLNRVDAQRLSTQIDINSNNTSVSDMLENTMKNVVGVSKIKENGNSVFVSDSVNKIGIGSGIIVSKKGYILSNEHVSGSKGSTCYITLEDGNQYSANVVWSDSDLDLSIIKAKMKFIDSCKLGDSEKIKVGENVYAIGNPIGYEFRRTVTSGIISAKDRTIVFKEGDNEVYLSNLIQTDAIINPGNSGGPLINEIGEVLGVNTVKITSAEGIGFAVPIDVVKPIIERFEKDDRFEEASIGIFAYDKNVIPYLSTGLKFENGIYIAQISLDSPAYRSGLQIGDIIIKIDDKTLNKMCDLREYIYGKNVGDRVKLTVVRNRRDLEIEVALVRK